MRRILIIRLSAIGDVVMASPLARSFKRTWTDSHVSWLVEETAAEVLRGNPHIDEIIVWPRERWKRLWKERRIPALAGELKDLARILRRKPGFDMAVDVQGLLKSGVWTFLSRSRERIGLGSREGSGVLMDRVVERTGPSDRISSQYLQLARELELETDSFPMTVPTLAADESFARDLIEEKGLDDGFIAICPFTTRPQKHWFDDRWTRLSAAFSRDYGMTTVVLGGPGDRAAARLILDGGAGTMIDLTGKTTLKQAAAVIRKASLLVGVDTGLTHMGYALGTPTIALFGATRPYLDTDRMPGRVLYHARECSPCRRSPTCEEDFTCMKAITTDEVEEAAGIYLERR